MFHILIALKPLENLIKDTVEYTRSRKAFNQPILNNQTVHFRLAELQTEVELLRSLVYRATGEFSFLVLNTFSTLFNPLPDDRF